MRRYVQKARRYEIFSGKHTCVRTSGWAGTKALESLEVEIRCSQ